MTLTLHYNADRSALLDASVDDNDRAAIIARYDDYVAMLERRGVTIDCDEQQTTYCWTGADEWPDDLPDFWTWHNS